MPDSEVTLQEIKNRLEAFVAERDWAQFHSPKNLSMAIAAEAAELIEHFLWIDSADSREKVTDLKFRNQIEEELADIVIYALEFANACKIDVAEAVFNKIQRNALKYPVEKAKGNAQKYTEFQDS